MPAREGGLVRFAARVEYDGTDFAGFQFQPGRRTVQGALEAALTTVSGDGRVRVSAAGRTDAGVHATGQVIAFTVRDMADERLARSMDTLLPADVGLRALWRVEAGWQPRQGGPVPSVPVHRLERAAQPAPRAHGARGATAARHGRDGRSRTGPGGPARLHRLRDRPSTTDPDPPSGPGPQRGSPHHDRRDRGRLPAPDGPQPGGCPHPRRTRRGDRRRRPARAGVTAPGLRGRSRPTARVVPAARRPRPTDTDRNG